MRKCIVISVLFLLLFLFSNSILAIEPNPTFYTHDTDSDGFINISISWSNVESYTDDYSVYITSNGINTTDYSGVSIDTDFVLDVNTTISYYGLTMLSSVLNVPDEIYLYFEDDIVLCFTGTGIVGVWSEWNLIYTPFWANVTNLSDITYVPITNYYGKRVIYIGLGVGSPTHPTGGVSTEAYIDSLMVNGVYLLDEPYKSRLRDNVGDKSNNILLVGLISIVLLIGLIIYVMKTIKEGSFDFKVFITMFFGIVIITVVLSFL